MKKSIQLAPDPTPRTISPRPRVARSQHGVVLIIALIILAVISLLAVTSIRNASSTISVSGNVRTTELATQAAEIALQHCENLILQVLTDSPLNIDNYLINSLDWQDVDTWDSNRDEVHLIPLDLVATYKRVPECVVERMVVGKAVSAGVYAESPNALFRIIARGFGPEVTSDVSGRPAGSVVWLQSQIKIRYDEVDDD
jgi:type IV pilus assembly protein PilX